MKSKFSNKDTFHDVLKKKNSKKKKLSKHNTTKKRVT